MLCFGDDSKMLLKDVIVEKAERTTDILSKTSEAQ